MLTNSVLQQTLQSIEKITKAKSSIWNMSGTCLVKTHIESEQKKPEIERFLKEMPGSGVHITKEAALFLICRDELPCYILLMEDCDGDTEIIGRLCSSQFEALLRAYQTHLDKNRFMQNLLLDNLLLVDIHNQAKKLHIEMEAPRVVYVIEPKREDSSIVHETVKSLYASGTKDFITTIEEGNVILVKTFRSQDDYEQIERTARVIVDNISAEAMVNVRVAYGTLVNELREVSKSYKEAKMALDIGRIFYSHSKILAYNELGIGRLIYQLPISLCEMFMKEVFHGSAMEQFDEETLNAVNKFFENNLNVSETARQLYVHRNTLVYRLEKIQKITGLDVRVFDDALTFKIAMMVSEHMKYLKK